MQMSWKIRTHMRKRIKVWNGALNELFRWREKCRDKKSRDTAPLNRTESVLTSSRVYLHVDKCTKAHFIGHIRGRDEKTGCGIRGRIITHILPIKNFQQNHFKHCFLSLKYFTECNNKIGWFSLAFLFAVHQRNITDISPFSINIFTQLLCF